MLANATNLRRAGLLLRAMAGRAGWATGVLVNARDVARDCALVATERELTDVEAYLVYQGWVAPDAGKPGAQGSYALTRHGIDESHRNLPAEPKPPRPRDQAY